LDLERKRAAGEKWFCELPGRPVLSEGAQSGEKKFQTEKTRIICTAERPVRELSEKGENIGGFILSTRGLRVKKHQEAVGCKKANAPEL